MKTRLLEIALVAVCYGALITAGCVSGNPPKAIISVSTAQTISSVVEPIAQGVIPLVLDKNPAYAAAVGAVADAIPAAFSAGQLNADSISAAIALIDSKAKLGLTAEVRTLLANALSIAVTQYQQREGLKVAAATDPGIQLILSSFATGLHNGVTTWRAAHG